MPRGRCAFCSSRFPPIPIRIPAKQSSRKFARASIRSRCCARTRNSVRVSTLKLPPPDTYDVAIAALFVRVADRKGNVGFPGRSARVREQLLAAGKPAVVAAFGSPYLIERFPNATTWLAEFSTNDVSQRAAARAIFGQIAISGQIPVTVPGTVKRGDGMHRRRQPDDASPAPRRMSARLKPAYDLLDRAVSDGAFPGGVLAVGWNDQLAMHPFGKLTRDAKALPSRQTQSTTSPRSQSPSSPPPPS